MYLLTQQYHRAINLLVQHDLVQSNLCCRYLAGACYAATKEWQEALDVVGADDEDLASFLSLTDQDTTFQPAENVCLQEQATSDCHHRYITLLNALI
jgi:hypothetical protein